MDAQTCKTVFQARVFSHFQLRKLRPEFKYFSNLQVEIQICDPAELKLKVHFGAPGGVLRLAPEHPWTRAKLRNTEAQL